MRQAHTPCVAAVSTRRMRYATAPFFAAVRLCIKVATYDVDAFIASLFDACANVLADFAHHWPSISHIAMESSNL